MYNRVITQIKDTCKLFEVCPRAELINLVVVLSCSGQNWFPPRGDIKVTKDKGRSPPVYGACRTPVKLKLFEEVNKNGK